MQSLKSIDRTFYHKTLSLDFIALSLIYMQVS
jgi:hypothetical protein